MPELRTALWQQFGAAIDTLGNAIDACPATLWHEPLWPDRSDPPMPAEVAAFWYVAYHTLFWLDFYVSGSEDGFAPPAPFTLSEFEAGALPERPYTPDELRAYLAHGRRKCHDTLMALTDEQADRLYPRGSGQTISYLELLLYNMRHVQEHATQLQLFLGQHPSDLAPSGVAIGWVSRARSDKDGV